MKALAGLLVLVGSATTSLAEVRIYNATQSKLTVDVTFPNGKVESRKLDPAVDSIDEELWVTGFGVKAVKVAVSDEAGAAVWSGSLGSNDTGTVISSGKGATLIPSGAYSGDSSRPSVVFMNITGDSLTLDLEGRNGLGAHRDITPPTSFDLKKPLMLDPRESTFGVMVKVKGSATPIKIDGQSVGGGRYYLVWKRSRDNGYRLLATGYLATPTKSKK